MTADKTRRITLHLSPERSKEIRARVAAASPQVSIKEIEELLTHEAERADIEDWIASLLAAYYRKNDIPLVKAHDNDPHYNHEAAQPLTGEPEPEGVETTA